MGEKKLDEYYKKLQWLRKQKELHKGDWITKEIAEDYRRRAKCLPDNGNQDIGERRNLRIELQGNYGLTELEAVNIINGYWINDIVQKYYNIQNEIVPGQLNNDFGTWLKLELKREDIKGLKEVDDWAQEDED